MFIAVLFTIAQIWKQPNCPSVDEWIKVLWYIYIMEYYLVIKRNKILPSVTAKVSEISQSDKDKYHMISFIGGI